MTAGASVHEPSPHALLAAARARTLMLASTLEAGQWLGPKLDIVNPPLWELGHVAWFEEHWCLRHGHRGRGSMRATADELYDSARVPHAQRWTLPLPDPEETRRYLFAVRAAVEERLHQTPLLDYFARLCAFHEEMHCEAWTYTRQTLGYAAPEVMSNFVSGAAWPGDVEIDGGCFSLGTADDGSFAFDNEKTAHVVEVRPFRMARAPVTNAAFAEFVEAQGYRTRKWWSDDGWNWRTRTAAEMPRYWQNTGAGWSRRQYDCVEPLADHEPVIHVSWYEAEAWCRWAGRRLPTEAEWEFAAATAPGDYTGKRRYPWGEDLPGSATANLYGVAGHCVPVNALPAGDSAWGMRQMIGNAWEWTADWFQPYPGFLRDPYAEYSEPWFGNHRVLRGGCHATRSTLIHNAWRNFYTPGRNDVYAGFRTCAL